MQNSFDQTGIMTKTTTAASFFFDRVVMQHPKTVIVCMLAVVGFLTLGVKDFRLDASAETLVLENDRDLRYSRLISSRYGQHDFLVLTYAPRGDLFSTETLAALARLRNDLTLLECVESALSILDVPLFESPRRSVKELTGDLLTLESPEVDRDLAREELRNSPLYRELLISADLRTTALLINFADDDLYYDLLQRRNDLRQKKTAGSLTAPQRLELKQATEQFREHRDELRRQRREDIVAIRAIMDKYRGDAELFLGGVSMIADDMITFIRNDLKVFGLGVLALLILTLGIIFRRIRWICLPMLCCAVSVVCMIGLLGWFGWEVTVVSSNFISLQLILTMSIVIHLIVRYRELLLQSPPQTPNRELVLDAVQGKLKPCVYAVLTTIAGFGSLLLCDILPVITFGWMMIAGLIVSLIVTFLLFPSVLMLMPKDRPVRRPPMRFSITSVTAAFTEAHGRLIVFVSGLVLIAGIVGIAKLKVENSFIDYFKETTEIYQGMKVIDQKLGGTTPLDVIVEFEGPRAPAAAGEADAAPGGDDFGEFDEFDHAANDEKYWFTAEKTRRIKAVHEYLENIPESGKVLSLATMLSIAENLNDGKPLDSFELALLYSQTPEKFKNMLVRPYVSVADNEVRFWVRVRDSEKTLRRNELLKEINADLTGKLGLQAEHVHLAGLLVLYNNMLQSLFGSQILTLGITVLALMVMFLVLFRSLRLALIAIFPNVLSIAAVLGVMGWLDMPLDMMTITIAAISVGIAVDDTIHYIHRFKREFDKDRRYLPTMHRCHASIGHAMYYTSVTIIIGFSILALSNFIPTIYFGLLTSLAMLIALIAALTLLPQMLILIKPFGRET
ncbi:MAG TPA: MMPL family transporter [Sedimentisphaerales bacterium]|nr:MMPL family transporter [Sedimentisphaerales bacterium]